MGRQGYNKRDHIEKSNILLERAYNKNKGLLNEQTGSCWLSSVVAAGGNSYVWSPGGVMFEMYCFHWFNVGAGPGIGNFPLVPNPFEWNPNNVYTNFNQPPFSTPGQPTGTGASNFMDCGCDLSGNTAPNWYTGTTTGCDLSCVDLSDPATDGMVAQGGGPNSLQSYDPSATYAPGSVVCHLDPYLGVTNVFIASANSGNLVPGGGQYPAPMQWNTAWPWPLPNGVPSQNYYWEPGVITPACGGNGTWTGGAGDWWCDPTGAYVSPTGSPCMQSPNQPQSYFTGPSTTEQDCILQCGAVDEYCCRGGVSGQYQCMQVTPGDCGSVLGDSGPYITMNDCQTQSPNCSVMPISGCLDPSSPNYDPSATTDCAGNMVPPGGGFGDTTCCGTQSGGGCMELWVTKCAGTSPGHQIGQSNLHFPCPMVDGSYALPGLVGQEVGHDPSGGITSDDVYTVDTVNPNPNYPANWTPNSHLTTNVSCGVLNSNSTTCDFTWASTCARSELNTGGQNSWDPWLVLRETGYNSVGCQHLQNVVNWNTNQLNSGTNAAGAPLNQTQISRKTEQIEWAQCQAAECGCPTLNIPPLTGGPTPPPPPPSAPPKPKPGDDTVGTADASKKPEVMKEEFTRMKTLWKYKI